MNHSLQGAREIKGLARWFLLGLALQGGYSLFEAVRHLIVDGPSQHAGSHFAVFVMCFCVVWAYRQGVLELLTVGDG